MFYHQKVAMVRVFADIENFALCARHYQSRTNLVEWQLHGGAKWEKLRQNGSKWEKVGQISLTGDCKVGQMYCACT